MFTFSSFTHNRKLTIALICSGIAISSLSSASLPVSANNCLAPVNPEKIRLRSARYSSSELTRALIADESLAAGKGDNKANALEASAELGSNKVSLEIAQTEKEIQHGLMERASMPEDHGMVFLFHPSRVERFWMKNCLISLDMLFVKDGKIISIAHDAPPYKGLNPRKAPLYPEAGPVEVTEVIELNGGYCQRHGIKEGDSVKLALPEDNSAPVKKRS